jgi:lysyl-tRNA synthetase class 2
MSSNTNYSKNTSENIENGANNTNGDYYNTRLKEIMGLKKNNVNPYPHLFSTTKSIKEFIEQTYFAKNVNSTNTEDVTKPITHIEFNKMNETIPNNSFLVDIEEAIMGRVMLLRTAGKKLIFMTVMSNGVEVQFLINLMFYKSSEEFLYILKEIKRGDIVGGKGHPGRSKTGEKSLYVTQLIRCAPCPAYTNYRHHILE